MGLSDCGLRAYLPGYSSAVFSLAGRDAYQSPNIGKLELARSGDIDGTSVSITSLAAPKEAKKHYEKALKHLRDGELEKAAKRLEKAIEIHPEYAAAWALLGEVRQALHYESGVREAFERAVEIDPQYLRPYLPLVRLEIQDKNWEHAAELAEKAGRLNPMETEVRFHLAWAQYQLRRFDEAMTTVKAVLAAGDPVEHPQFHALAGMVLAEGGDVHEAAAHYRRYLANRPATELATTLKKQIAGWEAAGKLAPASTSSAKVPRQRGSTQQESR
jgi:tetratricopeptide (TPR) repeat protein